MLYHLDEWKSASGYWYCEHTKSHPQGINKWVIPSRLLGISADEFLKFLIAKYQPDSIYHNEDCSFVGWAWKDYSKCHKFVLDMNKLAKQKNFQI
jgi:hypothetical protein